MFAFKLLLSVYLSILPPVVRAQVCLQANEAGGNLPAIVDRGWEPRIPDRNQAIVTSYEFQCCGSIAEWGADVYSNCVGECEEDEDEDIVIQRFNVQFQVWRPSPTVGGDGCYSLVGENRVTSVTLKAGVIRETPLLSQRIAVQPGDVMGFRLVGQYPSASPGVVLDDSYFRETVWYGNTAAAGPSNCPFPVGSGRSLRTSTSLGPVITASLASSKCPLPTTTMIITPIPSRAVHRVHSTTQVLPLSSSPSSLLTPTPTTDSPATTHQGITDTTTTTGLENSVSTTTDGVPSTESDQGSNEFAVGGAGKRSVTVSVTTASPSPSPAISTAYVIAILASGGGVVVFLVIVLLVVSFCVCRRVSQINKERQAVDPAAARFSRCSMEYNYAYRVASELNSERTVSNTIYRQETEIEEIYDEIIN